MKTSTLWIPTQQLDAPWLLVPCSERTSFLLFSHRQQGVKRKRQICAKISPARERAHLSSVLQRQPHVPAAHGQPVRFPQQREANHFDAKV